MKIVKFNDEEIAVAINLMRRGAKSCEGAEFDGAIQSFLRLATKLSSAENVTDTAEGATDVRKD